MSELNVIENRYPSPGIDLDSRVPVPTTIPLYLYSP